MCRDRSEVRLLRCASCETVHHQDCWSWAGGCARFGCGGVAVAIPGESSRMGSWSPGPMAVPFLAWTLVAVLATALGSLLVLGETSGAEPWIDGLCLALACGLSLSVLQGRPGPAAGSIGSPRSLEATQS